MFPCTRTSPWASPCLKFSPGKEFLKSGLPLSGFHAKRLNAIGELEIAVKHAEPENQAEPLPGPE